jgi:transposase
MESNQNVPTYVGIDVSAKKLDSTYFKDNQWIKEKIVNDWEVLLAYGLDLKERLPNCHCIVEYTGTYSTKIIHALCQNGVKVSVITPAQSHGFSQTKHRTTKNDKSDARLLAQFGEKYAADLKLFVLPDVVKEQRRQLVNTIGQLEKNLRQTQNQHHAYEQLPPDLQQSIILDTYQSNEAHLLKQMGILNAKLKSLVDNDEDFENSRKLMTTIVGIGNKTANIILAKTGGIKNFSTDKQLCKYAGVSPTENESGTTVKGRRSINRSGNSSMRKALYCASWSAIRYNKAAKELYERLRSKGKPVKIALIAVVNLLIRQIFAVVTSGIPFNNNMHLSKLIPAN